jgi:hypothetical protein
VEVQGEFRGRRDGQHIEIGDTLPSRGRRFISISLINKLSYGKGISFGERVFESDPLIYRVRQGKLR